MKTKILLIASIAIFISTSKISAQVSTQAITAVSFPKDVVPVDAGTIEFDARISGFSGSISVGGNEPYFFQLHDGSSTFHIGFNANDGAANGGLTGVAGHSPCGTGFYGSWSFEDIYEAGEVDQWHHYKFTWDKDGLPPPNNNRKVAIYIDGVLNTGSWHNQNTDFPPLNCGTLNLITTHTTGLSGEVAIDELKIYDGDDNLLLYNTLGSQQEIENSVVGLNGSFNGFGDAHFVPGTNGDAVEAHPVVGIGSGCAQSCTAPSGLNTVNITGTTAKLKWDAVPGAEGYKVRYKVANTSEWQYGTTYHSSKPISGLSPNTEYKWEVRTYCHIAPPSESSGWSSKQDFTTGSLRTVDESLQQISFQIYPNPAEDHSTIQFSIGVPSDTLPQPSHVYIKVYDVSGKEIACPDFFGATLLDEDMEQGDHSLLLNTNHFPKGVYLVKMISEFGIENQKLIVQ